MIENQNRRSGDRSVVRAIQAALHHLEDTPMKRIVVMLFCLLFSPALLLAQAEVMTKDEHQEAEGHVIAVPEMDEFHEVLHPLVHDAMPEKKFDVVRGKLGELLKHARSVQKAKLPAELEDVRKEYRKSAERLVNQIRKLQKTRDNGKFEALFDEMHMTFEGMMGMVKK